MTWIAGKLAIAFTGWHYRLLRRKLPTLYPNVTRDHVRAAALRSVERIFDKAWPGDTQ